MIVELATSWRSWATRPPIHVGVARQTQLHCPNSILCLAHPIKQHSGSELNTLAELGTSAKAALVSLLKHDECERGRDHPAGCTQDPSSSRTFPDRTAPCYRPCGVSSAVTNLLRSVARSPATVFPMRTSGVVRVAIRFRTTGAVVQHPSRSSPSNAGQLPSLFWGFSIASKEPST